MFFLGSFNLHAQEETAAGINIGPGELVPALEMRGFYNDNLLLDPAGSIDTLGLNIMPSATYRIGDDVRAIVMDWLLDAGFFEASSDDNYIDNTISAGYEANTTDRFSGSVTGTYRDAHDPRGTGRMEASNSPLLEEPDEWHSLNLEAGLAYGARTATGRIEIDGGYLTKDYDNNRAFTFIRDRIDIYAAARFLYRIASNTSLVVEGRASDHGYEQHQVGIPGLNSQVYRLLGGLTWDITGKTTGYAKLGYISKDFDARQRLDSNAMNWEVGLQWSPRTYSILNFSTSRDFQETNGEGDFIQRDALDVDWRHSWSGRFRTTLNFGYAQDAFDPTLREDDLLGSGIRLDYLARRWLTLGAGYRYFERDSNNDNFDYERNLFEIVVEITL